MSLKGYKNVLSLNLSYTQTTNCLKPLERHEGYEIAMFHYFRRTTPLKKNLSKSGLAPGTQVQCCCCSCSFVLINRLPEWSNEAWNQIHRTTAPWNPISKLGTCWHFPGENGEPKNQLWRKACAQTTLRRVKGATLNWMQGPTLNWGPTSPGRPVAQPALIWGAEGGMRVSLLPTSPFTQVFYRRVVSNNIHTYIYIYTYYRFFYFS